MRPRPLKLGFALTGAYLPESPLAQLAEKIAYVRAAEAAGFSSVWMGEHLLAGPQPWLRNLLTMARLAAETSTLHLGAIVLLPLHNILELAEQLATLDILCGGRARACFVSGRRQKEFAAFGVPLQGLGERTADGVDILRRLWAGESVTTHSAHYQLDDVTVYARPLQQPHLPIWFGGTSVNPVRRAARRGLPVLFNSNRAFTELEPLVDAYRATNAALGQPIPANCGVIRQVYVAEDEATARREALPHLAAYYQTYADWGRLGNGRPGDSGALQIEEFARGRFIVGDPDQCVRAFRAYQERLGVDQIICRIGWPGQPPEQVLRAIKLVGSAVLPAVGAAA